MSFLWNYADTYGSLIPLVTLLIIFYKKKYPGYCIPLAWYFILSIIVFGISNYLADRKINNLLLYNIFAVIELTLVSWFFRKLFAWKNKIFFLVLFFFILFFFFNIAFLEDYSTLNSNVIAVEFMIIIIYCFRYYVLLSKTDKIITFFNEPAFWIVSAFFIYFSTCIMVFVFYKYAAKIDRRFILDFWMLQVIMYLIKNLLITKGFLCFKTNK